MEKLNQNPTPSEIETNNEPQGYSIGDIKRTILRAREIREYSNEVAAHVRGSSGQALDEISERIFDEADKLYEENSNWVNSKIRGIFKQFTVLAHDRLKESFQNGLRLHIRRIYRTYKKDNPGNLNYFNDRQYIRDLIVAYTAEYILLLRQARKTTESPNTALAIAKNAHFLTVSDYKNLINKYNDLGYNTINTAAINYPSNPKKYLNGVIEAVTRLKENQRYTGLGYSTINTAAIGYPGNPEKFLDSVIETVTRLKENEKYASLGDHAINMAAIKYPSNPKKYLNGIIETVARLNKNKKYAGLAESMINIAAINYPGNPEKYLDNLLSKSDR
jgi:hypothetical protein